jgi:hypothetical protein
MVGGSFSWQVVGDAGAFTVDAWFWEKRQAFTIKT